ncbi:hypothetical protein ES708_21447 [subsurface metagenome]
MLIVNNEVFLESTLVPFVYRRRKEQAEPFSLQFLVAIAKNRFYGCIGKLDGEVLVYLQDCIRGGL